MKNDHSIKFHDISKTIPKKKKEKKRIINSELNPWVRDEKIPKTKTLNPELLKRINLVKKNACT